MAQCGKAPTRGEGGGSGLLEDCCIEAGPEVLSVAFTCASLEIGWHLPRSCGRKGRPLSVSGRCHYNYKINCIRICHCMRQWRVQAVLGVGDAGRGWVTRVSVDRIVSCWSVQGVASGRSVSAEQQQQQQREMVCSARGDRFGGR